MRVTLFTFHYAHNVGAFLQAFGLQSVVQELGYETEFAWFPAQTSKNAKIHKVMNYIKQGNFKILRFKYNTSKKYREISKFLNIAESPFSEDKKYEKVVIGSDEVWHVGSGKPIPYNTFYGKNINADRVISYAASASNTTYDDVVSNGLDFESIDHISVRDKNTYDIVRKMSDKKVELVCDPTILVPSFDKYTEDIDEKDYILVYSYGIDKKTAKEIKKFAKKENKKLISVGTYNPWCDKNIVVNPFEFLSWLKKADYVITSTFHGTVLSTVFNKQMAVYSAENGRKVIYFLEQMGMSDRLATGKNLEMIFDEKINYDIINSKINSLRTTSLEFLKKSLED